MTKRKKTMDGFRAQKRGRYRMEKLPYPCWGDEIDEHYFIWLCDLVEAPLDTYKSYWCLLHELHARAFTWFVPNDDNRVLDGLSLRRMFCPECEDNSETDILGDEPCSVFEMMVGLALRMDDAVGEPYNARSHISHMFFEMLSNLDLAHYTDDYYGESNDITGQKIFERDRVFIDHKLNVFLSRRFEKNGEGGLFPLQKPKEDQRKVEIWYQMNEYLLENYMYDG